MSLRGVIGAELLVSSVVLVVVRGERRVPDWTLIRMIFNRSFRKVDIRNRVIMRASNGIVSVRAVCTEHDGLLPCKCLALRPQGDGLLLGHHHYTFAQHHT